MPSFPLQWYNSIEEVYLGSADMMQRNLDGRVETLFPVEDLVLRAAVYERVMQPMLADTINARELMPDGHYIRVPPDLDEAGDQFTPPFDSQNWFITHPLSDTHSGQGDATMSAMPSGA